MLTVPSATVIGVRSSWLSAARKASLARLAASTASFAARNSSCDLSARNLAFWTKYKGSEYGGSQDPEVNFTSTSNFNSTDYGAIPMQRQLRLSFNFNF